jgi:uncharacterized protein DUF7002
MTQREWCELLNSQVFFWPSEERLEGLLCARAYRDYEHDVITVCTRDLLKAHGARVRLSRLNSGSTLYPNAPERGLDTFRRIEDFDGSAVAEVAVIGGVPDVAQHALAVERRKQRKVVRTIYRRR